MSKENLTCPKLNSWSISLPNPVLLSAEISPNIFVDGDASALKRLFLILLDNACKYSESPGVITVKLTRRARHLKRTQYRRTDSCWSLATHIWSLLSRRCFARTRGRRLWSWTCHCQNHSRGTYRKYCCEQQCRWRYNLYLWNSTIEGYLELHY